LVCGHRFSFVDPVVSDYRVPNVAAVAFPSFALCARARSRGTARPGSLSCPER